MPYLSVNHFLLFGSRAGSGSRTNQENPRALRVTKLLKVMPVLYADCFNVVKQTVDIELKIRLFFSPIYATKLLRHMSSNAPQLFLNL